MLELGISRYGRRPSVLHPLPSWLHRNFQIPKSLVKEATLLAPGVSWEGFGLCLVPCYGVSMGLPELGNCIDLGCNTPGTKAGSP